ncbi:probable pseudouridine-5'-phosphatase [Anthonomus grandis grandis]|uniref:probable pseudouridine-5'-phosphatase n=1 Tax=Anthonomus grandis grandis TaxID=2921223 RepID=UPI0021654FF3|nr:probable pseudouridine-5'-phosphatase [Anthonomus grandis grandis]
MHQHCCTNKYSPVTHVIFDLDGTILDSEGLYVQVLKTVVENHNRVFDDEYVLKVKGSVEGDVARIAVEGFQLDITEEQFLDEYHEYVYAQLGDLDLMPGAERVIKHLYSHNVPMAIATSSTPKAFGIKRKKHEELFALFDHIVCGGGDPEVLNGKPAPDIFLVAAARFPTKPKPSECLVFEDSGNGVKGALAAGMQVIMIPDQSVPHDVWKSAHMRLDSFNYFVPGVFGLPPFPQEDLALVFADTRLDPVRSMKDVFIIPEERAEKNLEVNEVLEKES